MKTTSRLLPAWAWAALGLAVVGLLPAVVVLLSSPSRATPAALLSLVVGLLAVVGCVLLVVRAQRSTERLRETRRALRGAEATVADQLEMLRMAGEVGRFGGWYVDIAAGHSHWSPEVGQIIGLPHDAGQGVELSIAMYAPEDRDRVRAALDRCVADGTPFDEDLRLDRPDGRRIWVQTIGRAQRDGTGAVVRVQGALQDVTARKELEVAEAESRRRFSSLADAMPLLVWTTGPDGLIDYYSAGLADYTGASAEQILGTAWVDLVHPDDRAEAVARWTRSVTTGAPYSVEFRIRRHDGAYRWHLTSAVDERDPDGEVVTWWGSCIDVHDVHELRAESATLAGTLAETLESMGDAVLGLDRDWTVRLVNAHAEELLQVRRDELVGRNIWEAFPEAVGSVFQERYEEAVATGRPVRFDAPFMPLGIHAEVGAFPHDDGLMVYFHDVTEQRSLAEQLAHAQRLESLGRLTGGVAHDFNNLLTVILGSAEVLAGSLEDQPRLQHLAETVASVSRRGADLTRDLLVFARRQPLEPTAVDVADLVGGLEALLRRTLGDQVVLRCTVETGLPPVSVDRTQLQNALLNLCLNARDALPDGGTLTLDATGAELSAGRPERPGDLEPGRYVALRVADDGTGIDPQVLDRVFDPFFTTKAVGDGSGLGLAMVYGFAKQSGGHVAVSSEPGEGTTFTLLLPVHDGPAQAAEDGAPLQADTARQRTVLLVEDDDEVREVARAHLDALGFDVVEAADGPAALTHLRGPDAIDVLLTDVRMPGGVSGPDLAARAELLRPGLPVLLTSGFTGDAGDGPGPLLRKPYGRADLARHLHAALRDESAVSR